MKKFANLMIAFTGRIQRWDTHKALGQRDEIVALVFDPMHQRILDVGSYNHRERLRGSHLRYQYRIITVQWPQLVV